MENKFGKLLIAAAAAGAVAALAKTTVDAMQNVIGEGDAAKRKFFDHIRVINCLSGEHVSAWFRKNAKAGEQGIVGYLTDEQLRSIEALCRKPIDREHHLWLALFEEKDGTFRMRDYLIINFVKMEESLRTMLNENDGMIVIEQ